MARLLIILTMLSYVQATIEIPDRAPSDDEYQLVYYKQKANFYQASRLCSTKGGRLLFVDGPAKIAAMQELHAFGGLSSMFMSLVRNDDGSLYLWNETRVCESVNTTAWSYWDSSSDETFVFSDEQNCHMARHDRLYTWVKADCTQDNEFVCEFETCKWQTANSTSLAAVPMYNASQEVCQATCHDMIGCFASASSGTAPDTLCIFVVVDSTANPMRYRECSSHGRDETTSAKTMFPSLPDHEGSSKNPVDCLNVTESEKPSSERITLEDLAAAGGGFPNCTPTVTDSYSIVHTAYVTLTPDVQTHHVTLTPDIVTQYVTVTPPVESVSVRITETAYVTLTPSVPAQHVTVSGPVITEYVTVSPNVVTGYVTIMPSPVLQYVTVTNEIRVTEQMTQTAMHTVEVTQPCSPGASGVEVPVTQSFTITEIKTQTVSVSDLCPTSTSTAACTPTVTNNRTEEAVLEEIKEVVKELTVDKSNVSRTRRAKESASDTRKSATTMGMSASFFLIAVIVGVFILDLPRLSRDIRCLRKELHKREEKAGSQATTTDNGDQINGDESNETKTEKITAM